MDQPTHDGVNSWVISRAARQAGLVVALSGLGGDELFGGYPSFRLVPRFARASPALSKLPQRFRTSAAAMIARRYPGSPLTRLLAAPASEAGVYHAVRGLFGPMELGHIDQPHLPISANSDPSDPRDRVCLYEMNDYLPNQLLRDTDQMSMSHGIEVRVPLLDDVVVNVALAVPARIRCSPGKALLSGAAGLDGGQPKRPFSLPFDRWLRGPLNEAVRLGLLSETLPFADLIPASLRKRVWEGFEQRRIHWSRPWAIAILRMWPEANGIAT
jgi:asparagine synthase (glutamine-hydrolysing)